MENVEIRTLSFPLSADGQTSKLSTIRSMHAAGWEVAGESITQSELSGKSACCLSSICLPLGFLAHKNGGQVLVSFQRSRSAAGTKERLLRPPSGVVTEGPSRSTASMVCWLIGVVLALHAVGTLLISHSLSGFLAIAVAAALVLPVSRASIRDKYGNVPGPGATALFVIILLGMGTLFENMAMNDREALTGDRLINVSPTSADKALHLDKLIAETTAVAKAAPSAEELDQSPIVPTRPKLVRCFARKDCAFTTMGGAAPPVVLALWVYKPVWLTFSQADKAELHSLIDRHLERMPYQSQEYAANKEYGAGVPSWAPAFSLVAKNISKAKDWEVHLCLTKEDDDMEMSGKPEDNFSAF